jgi:hypothetical protein
MIFCAFRAMMAEPDSNHFMIWFVADWTKSEGMDKDVRTQSWRKTPPASPPVCVFAAVYVVPSYQPDHRAGAD